MDAKPVHFQFGLRTLFVVVTLVCVSAGWIARQARAVHERRAALSNHSRHIILYSFVGDQDRSDLTSPITRLLGDAPVEYMVVSQQIPPADLKSIHDAYPEAEIEVRQTVSER